ncbi:ferredoxin-thioredoxin reductase, variable chain-like [Olea europaea var. sylvestris]|uniref:ferredoxin-thioredoxin reductase, variable chain-like n=1 Tax=Olea europaea var. sylvestris TaxID=158386 RepID=UPI000C1D6DDE|nr:ferredoxin-thioredoxin reductase, variable chain-like [Olea europaea var. sylvestris]
MTTSPTCVSSLLNMSSSRIKIPETPLAKISPCSRKKSVFNRFRPIKSISTSIVDNPSATFSSSRSIDSATIFNSLNLDQDSITYQEAENAESKTGAKIKVKVPLKVYHVPKTPEFELMGKVGVLKQYVGVHKGKKISANLPYKVEFVADGVLGRDGNLMKFTAHLKEDEFEFLD